jgi:hypothetical protein
MGENRRFFATFGQKNSTKRHQAVFLKKTLQALSGKVFVLLTQSYAICSKSEMLL